MALKKCFTCKGGKTVMGLGGLEKKCHQCKGIGYESAVENSEVDEFLGKTDSVDELIKTPERKKKIRQAKEGGMMKKKKIEKNKAKKGRPAFKYSQQIANKICKAIATTHHGLKRICAENPDFPKSTVIYEWKIEHKDFADKYAQARRHQADILAEEILEISDDSSNDSMIDDNGNVIINFDAIQRARLRVDSRKWMASKLIPKLYGDKVIQETSVTVKHEEALKDLE